LPILQLLFNFGNSGGIMRCLMQDNNERRTEQRLRYQWPIWFAENTNSKQEQGQMVDISSKSAAFTCYADSNYRYPGQHIIARFSVPRCGPDDSFDMENFIRWGKICRVEKINPFMHRIAVCFHDPLSFKPGEQATQIAYV
jgi:hypothetical protein